jgi:hypothetical protein
VSFNTEHRDAMGQSPVVVFVHLGNTLPRYAKMNLQYFKKEFPNRIVWFISDSSDLLREIQTLGVNTYHFSLNTIDKDIYYKHLNHPARFREGFWFKTILRFNALANFQNDNNIPIIHLENDVWLSSDFPFDKFNLLAASIAYPLLNESQGIASVMYLKDSNASQKLIDLFREIVANDGTHTDMTLLGEVSRDKQINFEPLPTLPPENDTSPTHRLFSANFDLFNGCFDAAAYGVYFLGTDPRNSKGFSELYVRRIQHNLPTNIESINYVSHNATVEVQTANRSYNLFCIHNHSKNLQIWTEKREKFLGSRFENAKSSLDMSRKFYPKVFLSELSKYLFRRTIDFLKLFHLTSNRN